MSKKPPRSNEHRDSNSSVKPSTSGQRMSSARGKPKDAPRISATGSMRHSTRNSSMIKRTNAGADDSGTGLQVLDDKGVDRTPKPLMSTKPGAIRIGDDTSPHESETASEFFLDRMSSNRGWSESGGSGAMTPLRSEGSEDGYDRPKSHGMGRDDVCDDDGNLIPRDGEDEELPPLMITERDLERSVYLTLEETETVFMLSMPCITVPLDSEEAVRVEAANKKYSHLLVVKQSADKYYDVETQTLDLLTKHREVQSAVLQTAAVSCQATKWDIDDTHRALDDALADAEEAGVAGSNVPSIGQLAGSVAKGSRYGGGGASGNSTSMRSDVFGHGESMMMSGVGRETSMPFMNSGAYGGAPVPPPEGESLAEGEGEVNELDMLPGLLDALMLMDSAVSQNLYFPKLLLYRDIRQLRLNQDALSGGMLAPAGNRSSGPSRPTSRGISRAPSLKSDLSMGSPDVLMAKLQGLTPQGPSSVAESRIAGPASVAESAWPEDLLQDLADLGPDGLPMIELLWEWKIPDDSAANVACMSWNKARPDLLAVGYGGCNFAKDQDAPSKGHVAFWSLKNPQFPLWLFETRAGVTALDFSTHTPNILAVGLYDGAVAIYDVKSKSGVPSMESDANTGRHSDPVWKVKWIDRGADHEEPFVSISTDGRVTQWSITKGLEFADLMKLKRVQRKPSPVIHTTQSVPNGTSGSTTKGSGSNPAGGSEHDAFISRLTSGMAFDFSGRDERIYIAGTEDGWIHKCSTSYSEQYLESYQGHMGPVYNVQWSPFRKDMFISASGDWTIRMWQEGRDSALLTFQSGNSEVNDVQWCPRNSTVFGSVTQGGRLEIWDFDLSTVKPVVTHKAGVKLSCVLFSECSPIVVCGGENGVVSVFRLHNIDREYEVTEEQVARLDDTIRANVMKQQAGKAPVEAKA